MIKMISPFNPYVHEIIELLYQYEQDYLFDCSKFNKRFPHFAITPLSEGIQHIVDEIKTGMVN